MKLATIFYTILGKKHLAKIPPDGRYLVVSIIDGDSFRILVNGVEEKCRLSGIDAPEISQQNGIVAKAYLCNTILHRFVEFHFIKRGRYKRLICDVFVQGSNLQFDMLRKGFAYVYDNYVEKQWREQFEQAQAYAWENRLGVHANNLAVRPWDYRNNN